MAETYKKIFPGNWVNHLNAHALPNPSFAANNRAVGDPRDRAHQAVLAMPGWVFVRKVGYAKVQAAQSVFDFVVPSPDTRPDNKPRADIQGLWIPQNAYAIRAGFRVVPRSAQPGSNSSGPTGAGDTTSGIVSSAAGVVVLATADPSTPGAAAINGTTITTASNGGGLVIGADLNVPIGSQLVASAFGTPQQITAAGGLTLRLYAENAALTAGVSLSSQVPGGAYIAAEVVYMVPEEVTDLEDLYLPGALYSGQTP